MVKKSAHAVIRCVPVFIPGSLNHRKQHILHTTATHLHTPQQVLHPCQSSDCNQGVVEFGQLGVAAAAADAGCTGGRDLWMLFQEH